MNVVVLELLIILQLHEMSFYATLSSILNKKLLFSLFHPAFQNLPSPIVWDYSQIQAMRNFVVVTKHWVLNVLKYLPIHFSFYSKEIRDNISDSSGKSASDFFCITSNQNMSWDSFLSFSHVYQELYFKSSNRPPNLTLNELMCS